MKNIRKLYNHEAMFHPGETLGEKLEEMGVSTATFAETINKPADVVAAVVNCESPITPDLATAFELGTKIPAEFWLNYQRGYDEAVSRRIKSPAEPKSFWRRVKAAVF